MFEENIRELKQPRRRRQQPPHKLAYLTMKNSIFARFARGYFIFWRFEDVLVLSTTSNDLFCSCVDDVSIWWQMFNFVFLCPKRWFQFNSRMVRTHFSSILTLNNCEIIAETRSYIFRWRSRFRCRRVCLKCPWHEILYYLIRKSFQNDEEWRLFYCDSALGCRVIQEFDLCKSDMCDARKGTQSGAKSQKIEYLCTLSSLLKTLEHAWHREVIPITWARLFKTRLTITPD